MLTAILYGRNDGYSYGLAKRAALGMNMLAEQLVTGQDEILFVDYNSDDDLPTFPEAISDTLTTQCREMVRVIRVRSTFHRRFQGQTHLPVLEAVARNIALRRAQPQTRWILSTNSDTILIPTGAVRLSAFANGLPDGYYALPRFEIPRVLWEDLPRSEPCEIAKRILEWRVDLMLEEVVRHPDPAILYDAPGDFQLFPLHAVSTIDGFDESMLLGWHIDSNVALRLSRTLGGTKDLSKQFVAYHCEHSRRISTKHAAERLEDSFEAKVTNLSANDIPRQREYWGSLNEIFEEFKLTHTPARRALMSLTALGTPFKTKIPEIVYGPESFDLLPRNQAHITPFLIDSVAHDSRDSRIGFVTHDDELAESLGGVLKSAGFAKVHRVTPLPSHVDGVDAALHAIALLDTADLVILDAPSKDAQGDDFFRALLRLLFRREAARSAAGKQLRRIVGVNVIHTRFEAEFVSLFESALSPCTTRLRQGLAAISRLEPIELFPDVRPGDAGQRTAAGEIVSMPSREKRCVFYGPYISLLPMRYVAICCFEVLKRRWIKIKGRVTLEVVVENVAYGKVSVNLFRPGPHVVNIEFDYPPKQFLDKRSLLEVRMFAGEKVSIKVSKLTIKPIPDEII